jgi:hypothetical protein
MSKLSERLSGYFAEQNVRADVQTFAPALTARADIVPLAPDVKDTIVDVALTNAATMPDLPEVEPEVAPAVRPKVKRRTSTVCLQERELIQLARGKTQAAIEVLTAIMRDCRNPAGVRARAAQVLLDRGWGAPRAPEEVGDMTADEKRYAAAKMKAALEHCRHSGKALPLWLRVARDRFDSGDHEGALLVALTENPSAVSVPKA